MKVALAIGTRPEAIKLAPVIAELRRRAGFAPIVVLTAQHRELLDQVLSVFAIQPDVDLALMQPSQSLASLSSRVMLAMDDFIAREDPALMVVQGDTTTALVSGLAAFYRGVPVAHVEAGLRTSTPLNPFPEEVNRRLLSVMTYLHCAPTATSEAALRDGGVPASAIAQTGNTIVDALHQILGSTAMASAPLPPGIDPERRIVLVTVHRRENFANLPEICGAIRSIVEQASNLQVAVTVHPNPIVQSALSSALAGVSGVVLLPPLDYVAFIKLMSVSWLVLTDSGGVQEEAPVLGRPVLIMREETERPEAVAAGVSRLVGASGPAIVRAVVGLLSNPSEWARMARAVSPFGDGRAASRIVDAIEVRRQDIAAFGSRTGNPRSARTMPPLSTP